MHVWSFAVWLKEGKQFFARVQLANIGKQHCLPAAWLVIFKHADMYVTYITIMVSGTLRNGCMFLHT